jgi:hypothetical protein
MYVVLHTRGNIGRFSTFEPIKQGGISSDLKDLLMSTLTIIEYARMKVTPDSPSAMLLELPMYCTVVLQLLYGGMSGALFTAIGFANRRRISAARLERNMTYRWYSATPA